MAISGLTAPGVPPQPKWLIFTKGAIILLAVIVLALAAYALSLYGDYSYYYSAGAPGYLLFVVSLSLPCVSPQKSCRCILTQYNRQSSP